MIKIGEPGALSPPSVWVEVPAGDLPDVAEQVTAVTERIVDGTVSVLRFALSDCGPAQEIARADALERAHARAADLADVAALAEVEVYVNVGVRYAIGSVPDRIVLATGTAMVEGPADEANLLFDPSIDVGLLAEVGDDGIDSTERATLVRRLGELGIAEGDIVVVPQSVPILFPGSATTIRVTVPAAEVADLHGRVSAIVTETTGRDIEPRVRFTSSDCEALSADARRDAFADAQERVAALASAADLALGGVAGISEAGVGSDISAGLLAAADPCEENVDDLLAGFDGLVPSSDAGIDTDPVVRVPASVTVTRRVE